jgi:hypothetical protein
MLNRSEPGSISIKVWWAYQPGTSNADANSVYAQKVCAFNDVNIGYCLTMIFITVHVVMHASEGKSTGPTYYNERYV